MAADFDRDEERPDLTGGKDFSSQFVEINPDLAGWMTKNKGMNFSNPADAYEYQFGPGKVVSGQSLQDQGYDGVTLNASYFQPDSGKLEVKNRLPEYDQVTFGNYAWMVPLAVIGAGLAAGAMAGAGGAAAAGAADAAGLATMAGDAGLTGAAADAFVASGGTMGSTAAGGGGVGLGASAAGDIINVGATELTPVDSMADSLIQPAVDTGVTPATTPTTTAPSPASVAFDSYGGSGASSLGGNIASGAGNAGSVTGDGLIDKLIGWGKENPLLSSTLLNNAGGLIKGAFTPTPEENYQAQYQARTESEIAIQDWIRRNNSLVGLGINVKPTGRILRQPGELPSSAGILRSSMR